MPCETPLTNVDVPAARAKIAHRRAQPRGIFHLAAGVLELVPRHQARVEEPLDERPNHRQLQECRCRESADAEDDGAGVGLADAFESLGEL